MGQPAYVLLIEIDMGAITADALSLSVLLPPAVKGVAYLGQLAGHDGVEPYAYSISAGSLPTGLTLDAVTGVISGTPTDADYFEFTAAVTDSTLPTGDVAPKVVAINVTSGIAISGGLAPAEEGIAYSSGLSAVGGTAPYTWSVNSGTLPTGLTIDPSTGIVSGTPTVPGAANITIRATDAGSDTQDFPTFITVAPAVALIGVLPAATVGTAYNAVLTTTPGVPPYTYAITSGALPDGLVFSTASGVITGVPTVAASFSFDVTVLDALGGTDTSSAAIVAFPAGGNNTVTLSKVEFEFLGASMGAERYDYFPGNFQITGVVVLAQPSGSVVVDLYVDGYSAFPPTSGDSICAAAKPTISSGVKFKDSTLTGWTTFVGADSTMIAHIDSISTSTNVKVVVYGFQPNETITAVVLSGSLPNVTGGVPYSEALTVSGGIAPYVNPVFTPALPTGLSAAVVGSTVVVSGTAIAGGTYSGIATVDDSFSQTSNALPIAFSISAPAFHYFDPAHTNAAMALSNADKTVTGDPATGWASARSLTSHNSGQFYAEFNDDVNSSTFLVCGVGTASTNLSNFAGSDNESWGVHCNKPNPLNTYHGGTPTAGGNGSIGVNGRACVAVDFAAGKIWLGTDALAGTWCGGGDPALGTSPTYTFTPGTTLYLVCSEFANNQVCSLENNSGENTSTIPSGYLMWG